MTLPSLGAKAHEGALLKGATLLHLDPPRVERADVRVRGQEIVEVGPTLAAGGADVVVELSDRLLMPGLVCGHHHLYSALACGMPFVAEPPVSFADMLAKVWWRLDRALDEEGVRVSGLTGGLAALKVGTTTIIDHHASPSFIEGSLEALDDSLAEIGQRRVLCYEVTDRGGPEKAAAGLRAHEGMLRRGSTPWSSTLVGVHANFTVSDETLQGCATLAREHGSAVHIHVAEAQDDEATTGEPLIARLERCGALLEDSLYAHCVHLSRLELQALERAGVWIAHQARSNMNNAVGYAPLGSFGARTLLGTDGIDGDMWSELKTAYFRAQEGNTGASPQRLLEMLAANARYASGRLGVKLGKLAPRYAADLVVLDELPGPPLLTENLAAALVFRLSSAQVRSVMIGGRFTLSDRQHSSLDEKALTSRAERAALDTWERMKGLAP